MVKRVGRYEIKRELGRGAHSVVYLAHDPELDRDVAVKTLHLDRLANVSSQALLAEARIVSRLRHPGIMPIFDVGTEQADPFLVFEYVPGENLRDLMRRRGALPPHEAAMLMVAILEAIQAAHDEGVIHRDLKPTNILVDAVGVPRVMDFGIAGRAGDDTSGGTALSGTPSYMAPEYINTREIGPHTDVFAAGIMLIELLTGHRPFGSGDPDDVRRRIGSEAIALPEGAEVDERLGGIALSATAFDPAQRYRHPRDFLLALQGWLAPPDEGHPVDGSGKGTIEFLLRRIRHKSDFPALSESVSAINRIAASENENVNKLSSFVLRDFSLTNKLLRLVNSSHFRSVGAGTISTVSRAVVVLGFDAVRSIAITVLLFEHLQNKANAEQLKEEFLFSSFAGALARELSRSQKGRDHEQVYICALFHNLGRMLTRFYFPDEYEDIQRDMQKSGCSEDAAALRMLGMRFEDIGIEIARRWGFPQAIVDSMRRLPTGALRKPDTHGEWLRMLAGYANEMTSVIAGTPAEHHDRAIARVTARYERALQLPADALKASAATALSELGDFANVIRIKLTHTQIGQRLLAFAEAAGSTDAAEGRSEQALDDTDADSLEDATVLQDHAAATLETGAFADGGVKSADAQAVLAAGIQDISNTMVDDFKLNDILRIILETMYRGMGFQRVILCIKDPRNRMMQGRFGFGPEATELARKFRFGLDFTPDIFHAAMKNSVDILISDVDDPKISARIPDWYRSATTARTFVIFPLSLKNNPVALIYADKENPGDITISNEELSLLRTLRNQAVLAIKQST